MSGNGFSNSLREEFSSLYGAEYVSNLDEPIILSKDKSKYSASENMAKIARAEWEDYKKRFVPIENRLISEVSDRSLYEEAAERGAQNVGLAFDSQLGINERNNQRLGITQTAEQQEQFTRQAGLQRSLAQVEASNRGREAIDERNLNIMAGGIVP